MLLITLPLNSNLYIHFTILVLKRMIFTCRQTYTHMLLIFSTLLIRRYKSIISMSFFNLNLINNKFANMSKEYARALLAQTTILRITHSEDSFIVLIIRLIFISQDDMTKRKSFRLQGCTYQYQFACICLAVSKKIYVSFQLMRILK